MKTECDKMAAQLSKKTEAHALLLNKYHLLKEELEEKVSPGFFTFFCLNVWKIIFHEDI